MITLTPCFCKCGSLRITAVQIIKGKSIGVQELPPETKDAMEQFSGVRPENIVMEVLNAN